MGTYDIDKVLLDYGNERITVEMAVGHALQHLNKLYGLQANANVNRYALRGRLDSLEQIIKTLELELQQLRTQVED